MNDKNKKIIFVIVFLIFVIIAIVYLVISNVKMSDIIGKTKNASVSKKVTATFTSEGLDYLEKKTISCYIKKGEESCEITLPFYNVIGSYNFYWSAEKLPQKDLTEYDGWLGAYFFQVGSVFKLTKNTVFYPNTNGHIWDCKVAKNCNDTYHKYRNFAINVVEKIGDTIFEFEKGIPKYYVNRYIAEVKEIYNDIPWLFVPGKVFALTEETYKKHSIAYGLTQHDTSKNPYAIIDLQYDNSGDLREERPKNSISLNATIHELAHAWDGYFNKFNTTSSYYQISNAFDVDMFYNEFKKAGVLEGNNINKVEFFAGMVTNYYWHVLKRGPNKPYYALKDNVNMSIEQKNTLKTIIEFYARITSKKSNN